jgi:hypothetical protein
MPESLTRGEKMTFRLNEANDEPFLPVRTAKALCQALLS